MAWFRHVVGLLDLPCSTDKDKDGDHIIKAITSDSKLESNYNKLCMACYAIVNVLGKHSGMGFHGYGIP